MTLGSECSCVDLWIAYKMCKAGWGARGGGEETNRRVHNVPPVCQRVVNSRELHRSENFSVPHATLVLFDKQVGTELPPWFVFIFIFCFNTFFLFSSVRVRFLVRWESLWTLLDGFGWIAVLMDSLMGLTRLAWALLTCNVYVRGGACVLLPLYSLAQS